MTHCNDTVEYGERTIYERRAYFILKNAGLTSKKYIQVNASLKIAV
jgi:hypothetical protein